MEIIARSDPTRRAAPGADFWLWWLGAALVGAVLNLFLFPVIVPLLERLGLPTATLIPVVSFVELLGGLVIGALVSLLQWLGLARHLPRLTWWEWIGVTLLGGLAAWVVTACITTFDPTSSMSLDRVDLAGGIARIVAATLTQAVAGAVLGLAQWASLRRHLPNPALWPAVRAGAGALMGAGQALLFVLFIPASAPFSTRSLLGAVLYGAATLGLSLLAAVLLGLVLVGLLRQAAFASAPAPGELSIPPL